MRPVGFTAVSTTSLAASNPWAIRQPAEPVSRTLGNVNLFGELEQFGRQRRLARIVLPGGLARNGAPLVDHRLGQVADLGALLSIDLRNLLVVGHRLLGAERLHLSPERPHNILLLL